MKTVKKTSLALRVAAIALTLGAQLVNANFFHFIGDVVGVVNHYSCVELVKDIEHSLDDVVYELPRFMDKCSNGDRSDEYLLQDIRSAFRRIGQEWFYFINHYANIEGPAWFADLDALLESVQRVKNSLRCFQPMGLPEDVRHRSNYRNELYDINRALSGILSDMRPGWWSGRYAFFCLSNMREKFNRVARIIDGMQ